MGDKYDESWEHDCETYCECRLCYYNEACGYCNTCHKASNLNYSCPHPGMFESDKESDK